MSTKYFIFPFAEAGDVSAIPDDTQPSGSVSYQSGFPFKYQLDSNVNPAALNVPRDSFNQLMLDVTTNIQQYQQLSAPNFITDADNGGVPFPYTRGAVVLFDNGINGPRYYKSLVNGNISLPSDVTQWQLVLFYAAGDATGTANAITFNTSLVYGNFVDGDTLSIKASNTNTGAATFRAGTQPAAAIQIGSNSGLIALSGSEIVAGQWYDLRRNGNVWQLLNPTISGTTPVGGIIAFAGLGAPIGFLKCDGTAVTRSSYSRLFSAIGTLWGDGDGSTTFNVPNLSRMTLVGDGGAGTSILGNTVGDTGGEESHVLSLAELTPHTHTYQRAVNSQQKPNASGTTPFEEYVTDTTSNTGGGDAFNVIQPSAVIQYFIKY